MPMRGERTYTTLGGEVRTVPVTAPKRRAPRPNRDADGLSADQRRTKANNDMLARGVHPATRQPVIGDGSRCGECAHHERIEWHNKTFHKCDVHRLGMSHGPASDIRVSWPACSRFKRADT